MVNPSAAARRALPSVDYLLGLESVAALIAEYGRPLVTESLRALLDERRAALASSAAAQSPFSEPEFIAACAARLAGEMQPSLKPVFNLTGTVLHTNLGRAVMPKCAADAVIAAMTRPSNLEFDLGGGARG
ncbi:MAG: L-seryl-tRNA(Sec) selenium transferase, partial [Burkholderiales bacterium]|nr:L-seryl-tRNA(Sec) selenium transferase [Burkholderiales bacterium]